MLLSRTVRHCVKTVGYRVRRPLTYARSYSNP
jgi:hypothetical protein